MNEPEEFRLYPQCAGCPTTKISNACEQVICLYLMHFGDRVKVTYSQKFGADCGAGALSDATRTSHCDAGI